MTGPRIEDPQRETDTSDVPQLVRSTGTIIGEGFSNSMDHDDPAYAGQSDYTRPLLMAYDRVVLGFVSWFVLDDSAAGLRDILGASFERVELEIVGSIAIFTARTPRPSSPG